MMSNNWPRNAIPYKEKRAVLWTAKTFGQKACTTESKVKYRKKQIQYLCNTILCAL